MQKLGNYVTGRWVEGRGEYQTLSDAVSGIPLYQAGTGGLDFQEMLHFARTRGNPALRNMTFHERGRMLRALALHLQSHLEHFYRISYQTGATRADSWIDLEGGIGNLFPMLPSDGNFRTSPTVPMGIRSTWAVIILSWPSISWFRKKVWPFTSTPTIFPSGGCWKKLPSTCWRVCLPS